MWEKLLGLHIVAVVAIVIISRILKVEEK